LAEPATITIGSTSKVHLLAKLRKFFIFRLADRFLQRRSRAAAKLTKTKESRIAIADPLAED
jgi:hypothetical protein